MEFRARLLIVEVPDTEWKHDQSADEYAELIALRTTLQILQSQFGDLDARKLPTIRVIRVRSPDETA